MVGMTEKETLIPLDERRVPALLIPPGETLREQLRMRGISQSDFAKSIGRPLRIINEIVNGKKGITAETALQFEKALGISAQFWMNLESRYRLNVARKGAESAARGS